MATTPPVAALTPSPLATTAPSRTAAPRATHDVLPGRRDAFETGAKDLVPSLRGDDPGKAEMDVSATFGDPPQALANPSLHQPIPGVIAARYWRI